MIKNMQENERVAKFKEAVGNVVKHLRKSKSKLSINKFALQYDFDRGNFSRLERGVYSINLITAWRISEALGVDFSEFAKLLEKELGKDFRFMDE